MYLLSRPKFKYLIVFIGALLFFTPLKNIFRNILIASSRALTLTPQKCRAEIETLNAEKVSLLLALEESAGLKAENTSLKKALGFKQKKGFRLTAAEIIACSPSSWSRSVVVNAGTASGIKKGLFAVDETGSLIGRVTEADRDFSRLVFINDPGFNLPVFIGDGVAGLLKGSLNGAKILYIENNQELKPGDRVWLKTAELPASIDIGKIKSVTKNKNSLFWNVDVKLDFNASRFGRIFIVQDLNGKTED